MAAVRSFARAALLTLAIATPALAQTPLSEKGWRVRAAPTDLRRIERLRPAWNEALPQARAADPAAIRSFGALIDPARALATPLPPLGSYRCRTIKLGAPEGGLPFVAYDWFRCRVERSPGGEVTLSKYTGSQRFFGVLYPDGARRMVFLGAGSFGDEGWRPYRSDPDRDEVGVLERVEAGRWRLALPWPLYESKLDLIEIKR